MNAFELTSLGAEDMPVKAGMERNQRLDVVHEHVRARMLWVHAVAGVS